MTTLYGIVLYIGFIYSPGPVHYLVGTSRTGFCKSMSENMGAEGSTGIFTIEVGTKFGRLKPTNYLELCTPQIEKNAPYWGPEAPPTGASTTNLWEPK